MLERATTAAWMSAFVVHGRRATVSAAGVKAYRQNGLLLALDYFSEAETAALSADVRGAVLRRGTSVFPALDPDLAGEMKFEGTLQPRPSVRWDEVNAKADLPPDVRAASQRVEGGESVEWRRKNVNLKFKNQRQIDRAYRRLVRCRERYGRLRHSAQLLSDEEEWAGRVSEEKLDAAKAAYSIDDAKRDIEEFKNSGKLELQVRRDTHINDALSHVACWGKVWAHLSGGDDALRRQIVAGTGSALAETAAALSGEVVVRLFTDSAAESYPFLNAAPLFFGGAGGCFVSTSTVATSVGLTDATGHAHADAQRMVVLPGSHAVLCELTSNGTDATRFQQSSLFDFGKVVRATPELRALPPVMLPSLPPGAALFVHPFTLTGMAPSLTGSAVYPYIPPPARTAENPYLYSAVLMPDRCAFTGEKTSWHARDSHGPLHKYTKGQLLTDDVAFPVLHRALDIE